MYPWLFLWAPQLHLPFGGNVAQQIDPNTNWFFDAIAPTAGNGAIERKAFDVASYGRQLGLITEVLLDIAAKTPPTDAAGVDALDRLAKIKIAIDGVKTQDASLLELEIESLIGRLKRSHKDEFPAIRKQIERSLAAAA